jgi:hypothetical protein
VSETTGFGAPAMATLAELALMASPPGVSTVTRPPAPGGAATVSSEAVARSTVAMSVPTFTMSKVARGENPEPVMVIVPPTGARVGVTPWIDGLAALAGRAVGWAAEAVVPRVIEVTLPTLS